ncbi:MULTISPECIES: TspO/MBR family protein [Nocardiopsis]|uniref:Peripheral-type benzodiazepine receptor n=1 Tax=Nocardiopsis sinuspersici TaxID=501010 RepID=A0A1V3BYI0_9ACTN|nr:MULTISPECIES: TspO/MBR family protein [Nocardiopsis]OOC53296.1 peripheral-type benzodiazepine receptor [Nocardiopsis sinuspersici]
MAATDTPNAPSAPASLLGLAAFVGAVAAAALVGVLSSADTAADYTALRQPPWAPPPWLFGPVWTALYAMIAVSGWLVWRRYGWRGARVELSLFTAQLLLNAAWTPLFFALGLRGAALVDICLLAVVLAATVVLFARRSRWAAALLVPYWAWVVFAAALNYSVWRLNTGG